MRSKVINVTQKNINEGVINLTDCPVALALKDAGFTEVTVGALGCHMTESNNKLVLFPEIANKFTDMYDCRKPVRPFTFTLEY